MEKSSIDYTELQEYYKKCLLKSQEINRKAFADYDENPDEIANALLDDNSLENALDSDLAYDIMKNIQQGYLDMHGGWPFSEEVSFKVGNEEYIVVAFGVSDDGTEKPSILRMLFIRDR